MPRKTRKEKQQAVYRLEKVLLRADKKREKVEEEFEYLDMRYVGKDLLKTVVYSLLMLGLIFGAKWWLN